MALGAYNNLCKPVEGYSTYRTKTSCDFSGDNTDEIHVSGSSDFDINSSDMSVSGWIKMADASGTSDKDGYTFMDAGSFETKGWYIYHQDDSGDDEKFQFYTNQFREYQVNATGDVDQTEWVHLVVTWDVSTTTSNIYLNGVLDSNSPKTDHTVPTSDTTTLYFGTSTTAELEAKMCEIIYWKGIVLSAAQVTGLYNNGRPRHGLSCERSYIKAYWKLNSADATGSGNVLDSSGTGHNGTCGGGKADGDFDETDVPG